MSAALDLELEDLPPALRWREWMARVEAVLFASDGPVSRAILARVVGQNCALDPLIEDIQNDLAGRPYEVVAVTGGWLFRTRTQHALAIRTARDPGQQHRDLTRGEALILAGIAYQQPITRIALSRLTGREVSRDVIARLHRRGLIARGPRSPEPGAPYTYVTTAGFLLEFGLPSLRDLPDLEALQDAGLLAADPPGLSELPLAREDE